MDSSDMNMKASNVENDATQMNLAFFSSGTTALWSTGWEPSSPAGYAATCIFLVVFTFLFRAMLALKQAMENRWSEGTPQRQWFWSTEKPVFEPLRTDPSLKKGILTVNGVVGDIELVTHDVRGPIQFRLSQEVTRAAMHTLLAGIGYLLMIAVMTLNVGYFLSILGGTFLGELAFGRYIAYHNEHGH